MQGLIERYMKMKPTRVSQADQAIETQTLVRTIISYHFMLSFSGIYFSTVTYVYRHTK